jgi:outer membrane protein assembly factor BamB
LDYHLRALRATDGKLLWTTENAGAFERLSLAGSPAIAGRFVYVVAVDFGDDPATLVLVGIDLLRGQVSFKTPLGSLLQMRNQREVVAGWDDFWEQSEPMVVGDAVYVTPNVGVAYCVGRFDGRVRWAQIYEDGKEGKVWRDRGRRPEIAEQKTVEGMPGNVEQVLRWRGTAQVCGGTVVIAPQDSVQVWGLEAATGKMIWGSAYPGGYCLVGGSDTVAIFAGANVTAAESASGTMVWRYEPAAGVRISGPAVVDGGVVWVPTSDGKIVGLEVGTGKPSAAKGRMASIRPILGNAEARKALEEARIVGGGQ